MFALMCIKVILILLYYIVSFSVTVSLQQQQIITFLKSVLQRNIIKITRQVL